MIRLLCIGKTNASYLLQGEKEYEKRIKRYIKFEKIELSDVKKKFSTNRELMKAESDCFLQKIKPTDYVLGLDEQGKSYRSSDFAQLLTKRMNHSTGDIVFIIGGAYGFHETLQNRFNEKVSLSKMTFSHQMVRMIFMEQLYRGFTILRNEPYHHEG